MVVADFWNYNIDGSLLKAFHEEWLYIYGIPLLQSGSEWGVTIDAHTSRSGSDDHNMTLSEHRARNMWNYLLLRGVSSSQIGKILAWGEIIAGDLQHGNEDDYDRRVTLIFSRTGNGPGGPTFDQLAGMWQLDPAREISEAAFELRRKD